MANLSEVISEYSPGQAIDADYEARYKPRSRIGLSEIGRPCPRWLWYRARNTPCPPPEGRILRLYHLGNLLEEQVVTDLMSAGYHVTNRQMEVLVDHNGYAITGHIDGEISGLMESGKTHLLEIKSSSNKRFAELLKIGYERWDEKYKAQIHIYAVLRKLKRILVVVYNKDNSELYTERITVSHDYATKKLESAFTAIARAYAPARKCPTASWFEAKWCNYYKECWKP